ncbi:MAG: lytic transglycosylase domain-containing protein, partial [Gemmatimonadota bacterium]|nr:lytic transglycosylase domain-containing protein [Gemmatimonadota bacterium]
MSAALRIPAVAAPRLLALLASLVLMGCASGSPAAVPSGPTPEPPAAAEPTERAGPLPVKQRRDLLGGVAYDLPVEANSWVERELDFLVEQRREVIGRWMARADFYEPFVKQVLAAEGVPTDLHHLAMIESGYVPTIRSRAGAVGIWQFMPATGRGMGLRVDSLVDERMDPVRSTVAAARHLRSLHRSFRGDWALAAAAYNAGSGRISRGMQGIGASNFWDLAAYGTLASETRQYVPRLYAMTIIARDRQRFGFDPPQGVARTFAFDSVEVDLPTPLAELERIGGLPADVLGSLNPHLLRATTPPGRYWVWTPRGAGPGVQAAFQNSDFRRHRGVTRYAVRPGEDLRTLAELAGVSAERLRELN